MAQTDTDKNSWLTAASRSILADREWVVTFDDRLHGIGTDFIELEAARSHPLFHGTAIARLVSLERIDLRRAEF